jgi:predicted outer membrane protein
MRFRFGELVVFGVFLFAAAVAVIVVVPQSQAAQQEGWTQTRWGPLGPADRDLLIKVRWAGLWEIPAGRWAQERSTNAKVKETGVHLMNDHAQLDEDVRAEAAQLGVQLPDEPNPDQQRWLGELSSRTGAEFDQTFADRLRAAHGKVFSSIAAVRAGTRNDKIREFASKANAVVLKHMTLLEETGLVDYSQLPTPQS